MPNGSKESLVMFHYLCVNVLGTLGNFVLHNFHALDPARDIACGDFFRVLVLKG